MVEKTNGRRIVWLDIARCFAIISISSNHAINRAFRSVVIIYTLSKVKLFKKYLFLIKDWN